MSFYGYTLRRLLFNQSCNVGCFHTGKLMIWNDLLLSTYAAVKIYFDLYICFMRNKCQTNFMFKNSQMIVLNIRNGLFVSIRKNKRIKNSRCMNVAHIGFERTIWRILKLGIMISIFTISSIIGVVPILA